MSRDWVTPGNILQAAGIAIIVALWVVDRAVPAGAGPPDLRDAVEALGSLAPWLLALLLLGALVRLAAAHRRLRGRMESVRESAQMAREEVRAIQVVVAEMFGLVQRLLQAAPGPADEAGPQEAGAGLGHPWLEGWADGAGRLLLADSDLETAYDRARAALESKGLAGELSTFMLSFLPFRCPPVLEIRFHFLSADAGQQYTVEATLAPGAPAAAFDMSLDPEDARRALPSDSGFRSLPWRAQPQWAEMVRLAALRHGVLGADPACMVIVMALPREGSPSWSVALMDFGNRCLSIYDGTCPEDLEPSHDRAWLGLGPADHAA